MAVYINQVLKNSTVSLSLIAVVLTQMIIVKTFSKNIYRWRKTTNAQMKSDMEKLIYHTKINEVVVVSQEHKKYYQLMVALFGRQD